jgi:hypothetical protein
MTQRLAALNRTVWDAWALAMALLGLIFLPGKALADPPGTQTLATPPASTQPLPKPSYASGDNPPPDACHGDIRLRGVLADVLSNALRADFGIDVYAPALSEGADTRGEALFQRMVTTYKLDPDALKASIKRHQHTNCSHAPVDDSLTDAALAAWRAPAPNVPVAAPSARAAESPAAMESGPVTKFARDVTLHVVLHEMGHALVREFDIPVLANEETMADAFATYYLTTHMPDRAVDVITARVTSLMIEAGESADRERSNGVDWTSEHDHDARRAYQIAALAVAEDHEKYASVAAIVGMSEGDVRNAVDYGGELRRSWRRVLQPLWMPDGMASTEAELEYDDSDPFLVSLCEGGLVSDVDAALRRFDWHSQVTIRFIDGSGRAGWSRSDRAVTVHSAYVKRFVAQGEKGLQGGAK